MVVCGDDGLAHRLAAELRGVHGEQVTLVVPPFERVARQPVVGRARASGMLDGVSAAVTRAAGNGNGNGNGGTDGRAGASGSRSAEGRGAVLLLEAPEASEA